MAFEVAGTGAPNVLDSSEAGPAAIRGGTWRIVGYLAGLLLGVVASALLFRHLGRHGAGRYTLATSLVSVVAGLSDLGLTAIGVRELAVRHGQARDRLARSVLGMRLVTSVVGVVAVAGFAAGVGDGRTLVLGVLCAGVGVILQSCQSTLAMALIADMRSSWVAAFDLLRVVLNSLLIVALVLAGAGLIPFLAVTIPVGVIVLALNVVLVRGRVPLMPLFDAAEWRSVMRGAVPYTLATAAATLYTQVAVVVVSLIAGANALGYFSVSARTIQLLLVLPGLAVGTALPIFARAARDDRARLAYALGRTYEVCLLIGTWVALAVAVGAPMALTVFGPQFSHSVSLLAIQGTGLGASFVGAVWSNGLLSLGRLREVLVINVFALLVGGALIASLVSVDGAHGAAIATAVWEGVSVLLTGAALVRADPLLRPPLAILPKVALAAGLAAATTLLALPVLVSVVAASVVYFAAVLLLRAVPREVFEEVMRLAGRAPR